MTTSQQDFKGLFWVDLHTRSRRFLWVLSTLFCSSVVIFGIWALVVNFYGLDHNTKFRFLAIALVLVLTVFLPACAVIIGGVKIRQKPGMYLRGIRIKNTNLEVGTLTLHVDSGKPGTAWQDSKFDNIVMDDWQQERTISNDTLELLFVLRIREDVTNLVFFEKLVVISKGKIVYQLFGKMGIEIIWNDIIIVSNGSIQSFDDTEGIPADHLIQALEMLSNIFSGCRQNPIRSRTLKIVSSPADLDNVLATGILGGAITTGRKSHSGDEQTPEERINEDIVVLLKKFARKNDWELSI
jgi:hypothetical protein